MNLVSMKDETANISIVNQNGQIFESVKKNVTMGVNQIDFNISSLPAGNYFINIEGVRGERNARQFVKLEF